MRCRGTPHPLAGGFSYQGCLRAATCHPVLLHRHAVIAQAALAHQTGKHGSMEVAPSMEVALVSSLRAVTVRCTARCWRQLPGCGGLRRGLRDEQVHFV